MSFMLFMSMFSLVMMVHVFHDHGVYFLNAVVHDFVCLYWFMALSCAGCVFMVFIFMVTHVHVF